MSDEIEQMKQAWHDAYAAQDSAWMEWKRLKDVASNKKAEWRNAQAAAAPAHEWEGRRVVGVTTQLRDHPHAFGHKIHKKVPAVGIVETYRNQNTDRSGLHSPDIGEPLVRLLNAKGEPGKKLVRLDRGWNLEESA